MYYFTNADMYAFFKAFVQDIFISFSLWQNFFVKTWLIMKNKNKKIIDLKGCLYSWINKYVKKSKIRLPELTLTKIFLLKV